MASNWLVDSRGNMATYTAELGDTVVIMKAGGRCEVNVSRQQKDGRVFAQTFMMLIPRGKLPA